jgi:hypothetical protein
MDDTDLAAAGNENLASAWALVGRSMGADVSDDGPLTLVATGLPVPFLNGAYVRGSTQEPERLVAEAIRFFGQRNVLQSSEAGHRVYRRMGFVDLGRYMHLEGPRGSRQTLPSGARSVVRSSSGKMTS